MKKRQALKPVEAAKDSMEADINKRLAITKQKEQNSEHLSTQFQCFLFLPNGEMRKEISSDDC